ncbi:MAG: anhydro-N-acetylmuramic acid kinase [Bacteroidota bacterium]|nr:anhydro-N-acetylmuramic acid kinase [Bacteroidota bacterium]
MKIIGVMSGTSLDGMDLAEVVFENTDGKISFQLLKTTTIAYDDKMYQKLKEAITYSDSDLEKFNKEYTHYLANVISQWVDYEGITSIDAIASHGHTIRHQPDKGYTLQIGNFKEIAQVTNCKVVCDFRVQDVQLGGQGAPLVPIGDKILFGQYDYCLNLGGFSNISFDENGVRRAYDICPVNTILNLTAQKIGLKYDDRGRIARAGNVNNELLTKLNALEFYRQSPPKSLGIEFVNRYFQTYIDKENPVDLLRTFVEHIAMQIAKSLDGNKGKMLVTGGGVYNDFLIERIQYLMPSFEVVIPDSKLIEYKEALIFALLGYLRLHNTNNVLSSVTGAKHDHCSGVVFG